MAAQINKLIDSTKRVVYKFTSDVPEVTRTQKIDAGSLFGALNSNNTLLADSGVRKAAYRLTLKNLWYDVGGGSVTMSVDGDAGSNTVVIMSGQNQLLPDLASDTLTIDILNGTANSTGNVFLQTLGQAANTGYTIIADFRKNPLDFNAGQLSDPMAFNAGPRAGGGGTGF
jgi:hypothetical protein